MTTWRELINEEMLRQNESWLDVIGKTLTDDDLLTKFDNGYGGREGCPFTLWTKKRVYFPVQYDGSEWVASVPRRVCKEKTEHVGG